MKVEVIESDFKFPRIMKCINFSGSDRISMITCHGNTYYETILKDPNPLNIGYRQVANLSEWVDFSGEIVLSNQVIKCTSSQKWVIIDSSSRGIQMKNNIQERINQLNIELNQSTDHEKKIECLTKLIELEKKLLDVIYREMGKL